MTSEYVKGHNLRVWVDGVGCGHAESCSFKLSIDKKELSDKDIDPGAVAPGPVGITLGKQRITLNSTGFVWESDSGTGAAAGGYRDLVTKAKAGTKIDWRFDTDAAGDTSMDGEGYITEFSANADDAGEAKYSITIDATGSWNLGTVS